MTYIIMERLCGHRLPGLFGANLRVCGSHHIGKNLTSPNLGLFEKRQKYKTNKPDSYWDSKTSVELRFHQPSLIFVSSIKIKQEDIIKTNSKYSSHKSKIQPKKIGVPRFLFHLLKTHSDERGAGLPYANGLVHNLGAIF